MTDRTEELKKLILDDEFFDRSEEKAELKGIEEGIKIGEDKRTREIQEWFEKHQTVNGMIEFYTIQFEEKFGSDKK